MCSESMVFVSMADAVADWMLPRLVAAAHTAAAQVGGGDGGGGAATDHGAAHEALVDPACATVTLAAEFVNVGEAAPETQRQVRGWVPHLWVWKAAT
jgi:23S rRNA G2445 N2-methylase RlmL